MERFLPGPRVFKTRTDRQNCLLGTQPEDPVWKVLVSRVQTAARGEPVPLAELSVLRFLRSLFARYPPFPCVPAEGSSYPMGPFPTGRGAVWLSVQQLTLGKRPRSKCGPISLPWPMPIFPFFLLKNIYVWLRTVLLAACRVSTFLVAGRILSCSRRDLVP